MLVGPIQNDGIAAMASSGGGKRKTLIDVRRWVGANLPGRQRRVYGNPQT